MLGDLFYEDSEDFLRLKNRVRCRETGPFTTSDWKKNFRRVSLLFGFHRPTNRMYFHPFFQTFERILAVNKTVFSAYMHFFQFIYIDVKYQQYKWLEC